MLVGIGLLTLVPQRIGGSETYARELVRGLSRRAARLPGVPARIAPDAAGGLPSQTIDTYPAAFSTGRRAAAMIRATSMPRRTRREAEGAGVDAVHFPLTNAIPALDVASAVTVHDLYHELFPGCFPGSRCCGGRPRGAGRCAVLGL